MLKSLPRPRGEKLESREKRYECCDTPDPRGPLQGCLYSVDRQGALLEGRSDKNYAKQHPLLFTLFQVAVQLSAIKKNKKKKRCLLKKPSIFHSAKFFVKIFYLALQDPPVADWCNYCLLRKCLPTTWRRSPFFMLRVWPEVAALLPSALSVDQPRSIEAKCC